MRQSSQGPLKSCETRVALLQLHTEILSPICIEGNLRLILSDGGLHKADCGGKEAEQEEEDLDVVQVEEELRPLLCFVV